MPPASPGKPCICTIVTASHLDYALALWYSYRRFESAIPLYVLVIDQPVSLGQVEDGFHFVERSELMNDPIAKAMQTQFAEEPDLLRWALKPVLMRYLLQQSPHDQVIFADCDLCFYRPLDPIWQALQDNHILLSPHWRCSDPKKNEKRFQLNFTDGMFNGGFIGASQKGIKALEWWQAACLHHMGREREMGYYDDQRYLDLLPAHFERVSILHHRGCNVANWNLFENRRSKQANGEVLILDKWPIVFIHFSGSTVKGILKEQDPLLRPYFDQWKAFLDQANEQLRRPKRQFQLPQPEKHLGKRIINKIKSIGS